MTRIFNNDTESAVALHQLIMASILRRIDMDHDEASELADKITSGLREEVSGDEIYVPCPCRKRRNRSIVLEFNGRNVPDLAKKHGLSERHIMRIISQGSAHG